MERKERKVVLIIKTPKLKRGNTGPTILKVVALQLKPCTKSRAVRGPASINKTRRFCLPAVNFVNTDYIVTYIPIIQVFRLPTFPAISPN